MSTLSGDEGGGGGRGLGLTRYLSGDSLHSQSMFFKKVGEGAKASHRPDSILHRHCNLVNCSNNRSKADFTVGISIFGYQL